MRLLIPSLALCLTFAASCGNEPVNKESTKTDNAANVPITLADVPASPDYADAALKISGMNATPVGKDSVKISFTFDVRNFELMKQTADAGGKQCNNSDKGQHIHFILDNKPYTALYEPKHEVTLPLNTEHYLLCFLSRSYHESVKGANASALVRFKITDKGIIQKSDSTKAPMLFYSRPKGDYLGKDISNVLLDFYPVNATLGANYQIKADVKNESTGTTASFMLKDWKAHFLQGLGTGKVTIVLSLVDKDGKQVEGPNTSITRTINLANSEPMK